MKLSVIIPFYKGGEYIDRTVEAVKKINYSKEILIVNDGSPDGSFAMVEEKYALDSEVKLFSKENGGIISARNYGVEHANGEYLMFSDQDDIPVGDVITKAVERADSSKADVLLWSTVMTYKEQREDKACDVIVCDALLNREEIVDVILRQILTNSSSEYANQIRHLWMGLYRREFVIKNRITFKRFITYEDDFLFLIDVMARANKLCLVKDVGYKWFMNRESESHISRYISDYVDKSSRLVDYCKQVMDTAGCNDEYQADVMKFMLQKQISFAIYEWTKLPETADKKAEKLKIKEALKIAYANDTFDKCRLSGDMRKTITHKLLSMKLIEAAFVFNVVWKNYFELRKRVGSLFWGMRKQK